MDRVILLLYKTTNSVISVLEKIPRKCDCRAEPSAFISFISGLAKDLQDSHTAYKSQARCPTDNCLTIKKGANVANW